MNERSFLAAYGGCMGAILGIGVANVLPNSCVGLVVVGCFTLFGLFFGLLLAGEDDNDLNS